MTPHTLKYTESHEWIRLDGDTAVIGITDHAQQSLGDVTFVELPAVGTRVEKGAEFGAIESVKAASDLNAPVGGEVSEINAALDEHPERVNSSPYEDGWMIKLKGVNPAELDGLMDAAAYDASLA